MGFKHLSVLVLLFVLLNPTECWFVKKALKKLGRHIMKSIVPAPKPIPWNNPRIYPNERYPGLPGLVINNDHNDAINKLGCKLLFGIACPAAIGAVETALSAASTGTASIIVGAAAGIGQNACRVRKRRCKRSVRNGVELLAFSDDFRDYDMNGDKRIEYEEFVFTVMRTVELAEPLELREPFNFADFNLDGELNTDEFNGAPFLFAHAYYHQFIKDEAPANATSLEVNTAA
ncbi:uncharacterized protein LOC128219644 [Mya arenaria]|uniref:uncharacterized protein LOC128219644 n=1 Tax=Mya arenaria TaxID=6604 RepID=UPI0022E750BE|nr:uncharacterized protein LOC128219644 [Mya arenaria]